MQSIIDKSISPRVDLNVQSEPVIYTRLFLETLAEEGIHATDVLDGTGLSAVELAEPKNAITVAQQIRIYSRICSEIHRINPDPEWYLTTNRNVGISGDNDD